MRSGPVSPARHGSRAFAAPALDARTGLWARAPRPRSTGAQSFTAALSARQAELDAAEDEWLALELLREEIEGA